MKMLAPSAILLTLLGNPLYAASNVTYQGDYCWNLTQSGINIGSLRLGVSKAGTHYLLNGKITADNTERPVSGGAEVINGKIRMTLNENHFDQYATSGSQISAVVNGVSFTRNGTLKLIGQDYNYSSRDFEPTAHFAVSMQTKACN